MILRSVDEFEKTAADGLTPAERRLIEATRAGQPCILARTCPVAASPDHRIRAPLLRLLILGGSPDCGLHERGVTLVGGWIAGELDLDHCAARGQTLLNACHFTDRPTFRQSHLRQLDLEESHLPGLMAQGARIDGNLFLGRARALGTVDVNGAQIGGQVDASGATLNGNGDTALNGQALTAGQDLFLRDMNATGTVDVAGAQIGGQVVLSGATLNGNGDTALNGQALTAGQSLFLRDVNATGTVDVSGAQIGGQISCVRATLNGNGDTALNGQALTAGQDLFLREMNATGTVDVNGARIGGQVDLSGATLNGNGETALNGQALTAGQSLFLRDMNATGTVDLNGAEIGGQMDFEAASLDGKEGHALQAQRLNVKQGLIFRQVYKVLGLIDLTSAHAGDLVDDAASWPEGPDSLVLDGFTYDRIDASSPLTLAARRGWLADGSVWRGDFNPQPYTQFARVLRQMGHAVEARRVLMAAALAEAKAHQKSHRARRRFARAMRKFSAAPDDSRRKQLDEARESLPAFWQAEADDTFRLHHLFHSPPAPSGGAPVPPVADDLQLARQDFRNRMRWRAFASRTAILWSRAKHLALSWLVGHGHAPHRAILAIVLTIVLSAVFFGHVWRKGAMVPNSDVILTSEEWRKAVDRHDVAPTDLWSDSSPARHYETFYALAYSFDVVVPLVDLGQQAAWSATTVTPLGLSARVLTMVLEVWGWIVTALGAAAVTGLVQRNQPD